MMSEQCLSKPSWRDTYRRLLLACGSQAPALRRSLLMLLAASVLQGLALACLYPVLRAMLHGGTSVDVARWLALMAALSVLGIACRWYGQGFEYQGYLAQATHELRIRLGVQLRRIPLMQLQHTRSGEMNALLLGSVDENLNYVLAIANLMMLSVITPLVIALATLWVDMSLGIALLLIFPLIIPLYRWRQPVLAQRMQALNKAHQSLSADIVEFVQGLPVLRAACQTETQFATLRHGFQTLQSLQMQAQRKSAIPDAVIASIIELGLQCVVVLGVTWVVTGTLSLSALVAAMVIVARFSEPLANCISYTIVLEMVESALQHIETLLAVTPLPVLAPAQTPAGSDIAFSNVEFCYSAEDNRPQPPVLRDISLYFPARQWIALVGPSGSGKSTLARLLLRYADPERGIITIGGVDLRHMTTETLNQQISVVFQDVYLFNDSVLANLRIAKPDATQVEIEAAARDAQCLDFIARLPEGWDTPLGDQGARLSGGERQRLSIARALLKNAPIVILDEPTAALDTESELAVQRAIERLVQQRTVITIAHRLSTIVGADRIIVIDNGNVVQQGDHLSLMGEPGRYQSMWLAQQRVKVWQAG